MKFFIILLIYLGEALIIGSEVITAKFALVKHASTPFLTLAILIAAIGSAMTVLGYFVGIKIFKSIWVITIICLTSIIILEPFIIYFLTGELPGRGALIGFVLGTLGFVATLTL